MVDGFPELTTTLEEMKRDSLVTFVRAVFRAVVPKNHEKVLILLKCFIGKEFV